MVELTIGRTTDPSFWQSPFVTALIALVTATATAWLTALYTGREMRRKSKEDREAGLEQIEKAAQKEIAKIYNSRLHEMKVDRYTQILLHFSERAGQAALTSDHERNAVLFLFASDEVITEIIAAPKTTWGGLKPDIFEGVLEDFGRAKALTYAENWGEVALAMRKDMGHPATQLTKDSFAQLVEALYRQR